MEATISHSGCCWRGGPELEGTQQETSSSSSCLQTTVPRTPGLSQVRRQDLPCHEFLYIAICRVFERSEDNSGVFQAEGIFHRA